MLHRSARTLLEYTPASYLEHALQPTHRRPILTRSHAMGVKDKVDVLVTTCDTTTTSVLAGVRVCKFLSHAESNESAYLCALRNSFPARFTSLLADVPAYRQVGLVDPQVAFWLGQTQAEDTFLPSLQGFLAVLEGGTGGAREVQQEKNPLSDIAVLLPALATWAAHLSYLKVRFPDVAAAWTSHIVHHPRITAATNVQIAVYLALRHLAGYHAEITTEPASPLGHICRVIAVGTDGQRTLLSEAIALKKKDAEAMACLEVLHGVFPELHDAIKGVYCKLPPPMATAATFIVPKSTTPIPRGGTPSEISRHREALRSSETLSMSPEGVVASISNDTGELLGTFHAYHPMVAMVGGYRTLTQESKPLMKGPEGESLRSAVERRLVAVYGAALDATVIGGRYGVAFAVMDGQHAQDKIPIGTAMGGWDDLMESVVVTLEGGRPRRPHCVPHSDAVGWSTLESLRRECGRGTIQESWDGAIATLSKGGKVVAWHGGLTAGGSVVVSLTRAYMALAKVPLENLVPPPLDPILTTPELVLSAAVKCDLGLVVTTSHELDLNKKSPTYNEWVVTHFAKGIDEECLLLVHAASPQKGSAQRNGALHAVKVHFPDFYRAYAKKLLSYEGSKGSRILAW